jgi:hypothetical protein
MRASGVLAAAAPGSRVLSIDIGMRNFAYCYYDLASESILDWRVMSLPPKDKTLLIPRLVSFVHEFQKQNATICAEARLVVIEQQMTASMRIMEAVCHSLFVGRARSVNPGQVKRYYRDKYPLLVPVHKDGKKSKSIDYVLGKRLIVNVAKDLLKAQKNPQWGALFDTQKKKDDFADSYCQANYVSERRELYDLKA